MKKYMKLKLTLLLIVLPCVYALAQNDSLPLQITRQYIQGDLKDYKSYLLSEEVEKDYNVKKISKSAVITYEAISSSSESAVIAVSVEEKEKCTDLYVFWIKNGSWKLKSIQTLRLPGIFYVMLEKCKSMSEQELKIQYDKIVGEPEFFKSSRRFQCFFWSKRTDQSFQYKQILF